MRKTFALFALPAFAVACWDAPPGEGEGTTTSHIVNGDQARVSDWPGVVQFRSDSGTLCGATLVHAQWAITAAHCVKAAQGSTMHLVAGTNVLDGNDGERLALSMAIVHENYDAARLDNDLALLKLTKPTTRPHARIISEQEWALIAAKVGTPVDIVGWGRTGPNDNRNSVLNHTTLPLIAKSVCSQEIANFSGNMICASAPSANHGQCFGDSGGPWYVKMGGIPALVGVVSWTTPEDCTSVNGAVRLSNYFAWMNLHTGNAVPGVVTPPTASPVVDAGAPPVADAGAPLVDGGAGTTAPPQNTTQPVAPPADLPQVAADQPAAADADAGAPADLKERTTDSSCTAAPASTMTSSGSALFLAMAALGAFVRRRRQR